MFGSPIWVSNKLSAVPCKHSCGENIIYHHIWSISTIYMTSTDQLGFLLFPFHSLVAHNFLGVNFITSLLLVSHMLPSFLALHLSSAHAHFLGTVRDKHVGLSSSLQCPGSFRVSESSQVEQEGMPNPP